MEPFSLSKLAKTTNKSSFLLIVEIYEKFHGRWLKQFIMIYSTRRLSTTLLLSKSLILASTWKELSIDLLSPWFLTVQQDLSFGIWSINLSHPSPLYLRSIEVGIKTIDDLTFQHLLAQYRFPLDQAFLTAWVQVSIQMMRLWYLILI